MDTQTRRAASPALVVTAAVIGGFFLAGGITLAFSEHLNLAALMFFLGGALVTLSMLSARPQGRP